MSLDPVTVRRIAKLARIRVDDQQVVQLQSELSGILSWIEQLNEVDVTGVTPMAGGTQAVTTPQGMQRPMRADVVNDGGDPERVLSNAPDRAGNFYAVPKVVE
jgi:aspartyl-tRNA(Asn)/glutamyl-tRNA(Gln) amidotransferase subunit C